MRDLLTKMYVKLQILTADQGQDLIEYSLVGALIAFGAIVGMQNVADNIETAFNSMGSKLVNYTS